MLTPKPSTNQASADKSNDATLPPPRALSVPDQYSSVLDETLPPPHVNGALADSLSIQSDATLPPPSSPSTVTHAPSAPLDPDATLAPGEAAASGVEGDLSVPGYVILGELGRGGMGVVYKARQAGLKRLVALKMILSGGHASPDDLDRFRTEAEAVARLQHPNIVQIYEIGEHNRLPYFSLEFCSGGCLDNQLDGTPWPAKKSAKTIETLAHAMHCAHQAGIVHRDLKPANVLLDAESRLKITDFGLAKKLDEAGKTQTGAIMGTPSYMAPEQAGDPTKKIGPGTDVYALGAMLYEFLTGRPPFCAETPFDTVLQVVTNEPIPPRHFQPALARDLETICLKCLQKEPAKRYPSALALAEDLHRFLRAEPILARPAGVVERTWKWVRRRPAAAALMVISIGAAIGLFAFIVWHDAYLNQEVQKGIAREQLLTREIALSRAQKSFDDGQAAVQRKEWADASRLLLRVQDQLGPESEFDGLRDKTAALLKEIQPHLENAQESQKAQHRFEEFKSRYNAILARQMGLAGENPADQRALTIDLAKAALSLFAAGDGGSDFLSPDNPYLRPEQKTEIATMCYELLLMEADAEAKSGSKSQSSPHLEKALALLDEATRLGVGDTQIIHRRRAEYLEQLGRTAEAQQELARFASIRQPSAIDEFLQGADLYRAGDYAQATRALENSLRHAPKRFWTRYYLALCYLREQQPRLAKVNLDSCLEQNVEPAWVYLLRGFAATELNELNAAQEDFQGADRALQNQAQPDVLARYCLHVYRGVMHARQARDDRESTKSEAVQASASAIRAFQAAIQLQPQLAPAYVDLAQVYAQQRHLTEAVVQLDMAIQRAQASPILANLYMQRGQLRLQQRDAMEANINSEPARQRRQQFEKDALRDLQETVRLEVRAKKASPILETAYLEQGRIYADRKQYRDALSASEAALNIRRDNVAAWKLKGEMLLALQQYEPAIDAFTGCLALKPDPDIYQGLALARFQSGKFAAAVKDYTAALSAYEKSNSKDVAKAAKVAGQPLAAKISQALSGRGWASLAENKTSQGFEDFRDAVRIDPKNAYAKLGLGYISVKRAQSDEDIQKAIQDTESGLSQGTRAPGLWYTAARIYAQAGSKSNRQSRKYQQQAVDCLRESLKLLPDDQQRVAFWKSSVFVYDPAAKKSYFDPDFKPVVYNESFQELEQEISRLQSNDRN